MFDLLAQAAPGCLVAGKGAPPHPKPKKPTRGKHRGQGCPPKEDQLPKQKCPRPSIMNSPYVTGAIHRPSNPDLVPGVWVDPLSGRRYREDLRG